MNGENPLLGKKLIISFNNPGKVLIFSEKLLYLVQIELGFLLW